MCIKQKGRLAGLFVVEKSSHYTHEAKWNWTLLKKSICIREHPLRLPVWTTGLMSVKPYASYVVL